MSTIEQRLAAYTDELDAAADLADTRRDAPRGATRMHRWQTQSIATAAVVMIGAGLWAISGRDNASDSPVASGPDTTTTAVAGTAVAGSAAPWYRVTAGGLTAQPIEQETCCTENDTPGPPIVESWQAAGGPSNGLLVLTAYPAAEAGGAGGGPDATVIPQSDGSVWQFWSYGMTSQRREALAAQVVPGSGLPFVLPDESMSLLSIGGLGPAAHTRTQIYFSSATGDGGPDGTAFATISVGSDRGLFRSMASSLSLTDTTVAGMPAFRSETSDGAVIFDWPATAGQWASLSVGRALADRADSIAASVVPDQSELLPPGMTGQSRGASTQSSALAAQAADTLAALGWTATLQEHETRTTSTGTDVQWAYFDDGDRRLFIVTGPPDLLDGTPDLKRHLTAAPDLTTSTTIYVWPRETWLLTEAITTDSQTIIIRSEGTDPTRPARDPEAMDALLRTAAAQW